MGSLNNDIERYIKGELTAAEMHALEQKALRDPFLAEALEGAEHLGADHFATDIALLKRSVKEKSKSPKKFRRTITLNGWGLYSGIAAGLALLAVSTYVIFLSLGNNLESKTLATNEKAKAEEQTSVREEPTPALKADTLIALNESSTAPVVAEEPAPVQKPSQKTSSPVQQQPPAETPSGPYPMIEPITESVTEEAGVEEADHNLHLDHEVVAVLDSVQVENVLQGKVAGVQQSSASRDRSEVSSVVLPNGFVANEITGRVTGESGEAIPGVNVLIKGTNHGTLTDVNGNFKIQLPHPDQTLVFSFIGYGVEEVPTKGVHDINVTLQPDLAALSEVVVVGYSDRPAVKANQDPIFELAEPEGGFIVFKKYLQDQLQYPKEALENKIEGTVTLQFVVTTEGKLTDFKVVKSLGYGCDEELIRLVQNGPRWKPTVQDNDIVEDKVRVRLRFKLPEEPRKK